MLNLLQIGLPAIAQLAPLPFGQRSRRRDNHPLAAYPKLMSIMDRAESSGLLAAERRALAARRLIN